MAIGRQHARDLRQVHQGLSFVAHADLDPANPKCRAIDRAPVDLDRFQ
jgi:hypothetical protein